MNKEKLLYILTGTETPIQISERENHIINTCLTLINLRDDIIKQLEELNENNKITITTLNEIIETKSDIITRQNTQINHLPQHNFK